MGAALNQSAVIYGEDRVPDDVPFTHNKLQGPGLALGILSTGTQIFAEAGEQADLRIFRYFPAGKRPVGRFLGTENLIVAENRLNLAEVVCLK
jgi:hypothetical protein